MTAEQAFDGFGYAGPEPATSVLGGSLRGWKLEYDGTLYRIYTLSIEIGTFLMLGHGWPHGTWWFTPRMVGPGEIAWDYIAEKLELREGDRPGWSRLIEAATQWRVR